MKFLAVLMTLSAVGLTAGDEGTAGSTQRITGGWHASWPMLAA